MIILERVKQHKKIAYGILNELELMEHWGRIGNPFFVGASACNLIVKSDIDIEN